MSAPCTERAGKYSQGMMILSLVHAALATPVDLAPTCLTPTAVALQQEDLTPLERAEAEAALGPSPIAVGTAPPPPPGTLHGLCWQTYGTHEVVGERFTVQWDTAGITETQAESMVASLDDAYEIQVTELGWLPPNGIDQYNMLVYVMDEPGQYGAYTTIESCSDLGYMPYIAVTSGALQTGAWIDDCLAHELNHAVQFAYGATNTFDGWWWEATAVWMQEYVYPTHNYWSDNTYAFAMLPHLAMHASNQASTNEFWHMYGMAVWGFFLDEHIGGSDLVRATWEYAGANHEGSMPEVIAGLGYDFDALFTEFLVTTTTMDFDESAYFWPVEPAADVDALPFGATPTANLPGGLGENYVRIDRGAHEPNGSELAVTLTSDEDVDWFVVLATQSDDGPVFTRAEQVEAGTWVTHMPWDGSEDAWLVVSPDTDSTSSFSYAYELTWIAREPLEVDEVTPEDTGELDVPGIERVDNGEPVGCGCAATPSRGQLAPAAMVLLALTCARRSKKEERRAPQPAVLTYPQ